LLNPNPLTKLTTIDFLAFLKEMDFFEQVGQGLTNGENFQRV
jgi:hypothetical protein